jgi:hypothetical protein
MPIERGSFKHFSQSVGRAMHKKEWNTIKNHRDYKEYAYEEMKKDVQTLMYYGKAPRACWLVWRYGIQLDQFRRMVRAAGDSKLYVEKVIDNSHFILGKPRKWRAREPPHWPGQVVPLEFFHNATEVGIRDSGVMGEWAIEHGYLSTSRMSLVPYEELKEKVQTLMSQGRAPGFCWAIRNYGLSPVLITRLVKEHGDVARFLSGHGGFPSFVIETPGKKIEVKKTPDTEETYQFMDLDDFYAGKPHTSLSKHYGKIRRDVQEFSRQGMVPCDCWLTQKYGLTLMQNHLRAEAERHGDTIDFKVMEGAGSAIYFTIEKKKPPFMYGQCECAPFVCRKRTPPHTTKTGGLASRGTKI